MMQSMSSILVIRHAFPKQYAYHQEANYSKGPVMAYMKKVTNATGDDGLGDGWFKISEAGLNVASKSLESLI